MAKDWRKSHLFPSLWTRLSRTACMRPSTQSKDLKALFSGCAIVARIGGVQQHDWIDNLDNKHIIPALVLRGSFQDQCTDGRMYMKDSIVKFHCDNVEHEDTSYSTCRWCQTFLPSLCTDFPHGLFRLQDLFLVLPARFWTCNTGRILSRHQPVLVCKENWRFLARSVEIARLQSTTTSSTPTLEM